MTKFLFQGLSIIIDNYRKQKYGLKKLQVYLKAWEIKADPYKIKQKIQKIYTFLWFLK